MVERGGDAGDEHGVVGEPPRHLRDAADREAAALERPPELVEPRIRTGFERRWLPSNALVPGNASLDRAAHAGEAKAHATRNPAGARAPTVGIVAEQKHERSAHKPRERAADDLEVIAAQGDQNEIESPVRTLDDARRRTHAHAIGDVMGEQTAARDVVGPRAVRQDRDLVSGGPQLGAVTVPMTPAPTIRIFIRAFAGCLPGLVCAAGRLADDLRSELASARRLRDSRRCVHGKRPSRRSRA